MKPENVNWGKVILPALLALALLNSCVYFNTLYNARRKFNEAEEARVKGGNGKGASGKYDQVIEKCGTILRDHSDSRWADDATFLMGKAQVRKGDYKKGIRKFTELITNFPESDYVPPSLYWLALANYLKKDYTQAKLYADRFIANHPQHEMRYQVLFLAGDINIELEKNQEALNFYSMVADEAKKREIMEEAVMRSGDLHYRFKDWEAAASYYERLLHKGISTERRIYLSIKLGDCYSHTGRCQEALELYNEVLDLVTLTQDKAVVHLGRGASYTCMDSLQRAIEIYEMVKNTYPGSKFSAEAYYKMGVIYHERLDSLERAQDVFSRVGRDAASSEFASLALKKSRSLKQLIELQQSAGKEQTNDQKVNNKFLTAELQLTKLGETALAMRNYQAVVDSFPRTEIAPKAAYALAWIYHNQLKDEDKALLAYRRVISGYPRSPQARGALNGISVLGGEELLEGLEAYIDSALADTTALREEARLKELERIKNLPTETTGGVPPDSTEAEDRIKALRDRTRQEARFPLRSNAGDTLSVKVPDRASSPDTLSRIPPPGEGERADPDSLGSGQNRK
ncbi:MAG: tetratricopeptide repeat protein [Candidatus Krumholzibacteriota bacterium]|nr:tetratricopeptide repeat protein [Candidatus Krumholzibacteriota bacterium]